MPISSKDREFMEQVAAYFRSTRTLKEPDGSIRDTARKFDINRNKVRKILVTMGELSSPLTQKAIQLRGQGLSIREISLKLGVSVSTVSTALPYEDKIDNSLEPSNHAAEVRNYRAYEKAQRERQVARQVVNVASGQEIMKDCREDVMIKDMKMNDTMPNDVIRLHMELVQNYPSEEVTQILKRYGGLEYGENISRDVIVPADIPLYAVHYMIQRAFGWKNSHLHMFELPEDVYRTVTQNNALMWSRLTGVLFRSPFMDDADVFWADDYAGGSFKNWIRKKYTGPYLSLCHGEGIISCHSDMEFLDPDVELYVLYQNSYDVKAGKYSGPEYVAQMMPVYDHKGMKQKEPAPWQGDSIPYRVEILCFRDAPSEGLRTVFEKSPDALLERLPVTSVLTVSEELKPAYGSVEENEKMVSAAYRSTESDAIASGQELYAAVEFTVKRILKEQNDDPQDQPVPVPVTDTIIYNYDFGDDWQIRITASRNGTDLVDAGRITRGGLNRAVTKCRKLYRPVLIARDGSMLIDDAGGLNGFADFLEYINPVLDCLKPKERRLAEKKKEEYLNWAMDQGWYRDDATDYNLL